MCKLIRHEQQLEYILNVIIADKDSRLGVLLDIFVEHEVDARRTRHDLEYGFQTGVAKLQGD